MGALGAFFRRSSGARLQEATTSLYDTGQILPPQTTPPEFVAIKSRGPWKIDVVLRDEDRWRMSLTRQFHMLNDGSVVVRASSSLEQGWSNDVYVESRKDFLWRSADGGITWQSYEGPVLDPMESKLRDGTLVRIYMGGGRSVEEKRALLKSVGANPETVDREGADLWPESMKEELARQGMVVFATFPGVVGTETHLSCARSEDGGKTYTHQVIDLPPLSRVYGSFRRPIQLKDGTLLAACTGRRIREGPDKVEEYSGSGQHMPEFSFVLRSRDKGKTWSFHPIAEDKEKKLQFNETELLELPNGQVMAMMRCHKFRAAVGGHLYQSMSDDGGISWSPFKKTPIWGYPAQLILLRSGKVLCTYAHRRHPYGARACLSHDLGLSWDYENEKVIRDDSLPGLVDYPTSTQLQDGTILTLYTISKIPRIPYREDDQISPDLDLLIHRRTRRGERREWWGGYHAILGVSRYTEDYVRAPGQVTSRTMWDQGTGHDEE
ncbi:MAG TPA: sialidase family protein [Acidobacteriota bacterium]|nr:sialidase family protein [Acidobacteriota bacterium]